MLERWLPEMDGLKMTNEFRGDNAHLRRSINVLLEHDAKGALAPHLTRRLLEPAVVRLKKAEVSV